MIALHPRSPRRSPSFVLTLLLTLGVVPAAEIALAQSAAPIGTTTVRPPTTSSSSQARSQSAGRYRGHGQYRGAHRNVDPRSANRHLVSPLGSAANVRPGAYQGYYGGGAAPLHLDGYSGGYYHPGYVVYVDGVIDPPVYGEPRPVPDPAPAPPPPAITIINQIPPQPQAQPTAPAPTTEPAPRPEPRRPRSTEPRAVHLEIRPADALVLLDDEPLGTALELTSGDPFALPPGVYVLEVTHPDFQSQRLVFGVDEEDSVHVVVDLTTDRPNRRTRVR